MTEWTPRPRLSAEQARKLKGNIDLPGKTERQAEHIASRLNQILPYGWTSIGWRYRVLNRYPSGTLYLALVSR